MTFMLHFKRSKTASVIDLLLRQTEVTRRGACVALDAVESSVSIDDCRENINKLEHDGDDVRLEVVKALSRAWSTPLDREDLFRLSRSIDDVLDNMRDFVRELYLWKGSTGSYANVALTHVISSLRCLESAISADSPQNMRISCLSAGKEASHVRRAFESGLAELYSGEITAEMLKSRDLLRRLDVVGLRLSEAIDTVLDGLVKRGQ